MNIINNGSENLANMIVPIDDDIILKIIKVALKCKRDTERYNLRDYIYTSKYIIGDLGASELQLEDYLKTNFLNVRTQNQNKEYKWVKINSQNMGQITDRYYIAPNPNDLHQLVGKLVESFDALNVPVRFKYQLTSNMDQCDRIIIYSDFEHNKDVLKCIKSVYDDNKQLFDGCERSIAWLFNTSIPGVYTVPEIDGEAYSNVFSDVILEAKDTFNFLYGLTTSNPTISLSGQNTEKAMEYMKLIVPSIMLRKGILKTKDGRVIKLIDKNVKTRFNYDTGVLSHFNMDDNGYCEVQFDQSHIGKDAMFKNFYSVSKIEPQDGLHLKYQTLQERSEELARFFYPSKYDNQLFQKKDEYNKK